MDNTEKKQSLHLADRKRLVVDGVSNIESLNEDYLEFMTSFGLIGVEGSALKVEELCAEEGRITVVGLISGIFYRESSPAKSFFEKLFK